MKYNLLMGVVGICLLAGCASTPVPEAVTVTLPPTNQLFDTLPALPNHAKDSLGKALLSERANNLDVRHRYNNASNRYTTLRQSFTPTSR